MVSSYISFCFISLSLSYNNVLYDRLYVYAGVWMVDALLALLLGCVLWYIGCAVITQFSVYILSTLCV